MPYCPTCEDEFRPGFTRCPDCEVALVDELPVIPEPDDDVTGEDFVVEVHRGVSDIRFQLVRSLLEGSGVPVHVQFIGMGRWTELGGLGAITGMPSELNAARLLVREEDSDRARALLEAAETGRLALPDEDGLGDMGGPPLAER